MGKKRHRENPLDRESSGPSEDISPKEQKKPVLWKSIITSLFAIIVFFGLLEGVLALFGVNPALRSKDPFVGFVSNIPLFVERTETDGHKIMATADNKLVFFNPQQFPKEKAPGTYRIFCLGGSTTYGRPYDDTTSFPGWLRELLPVADTHRNWEVINAGGISYASYRVANLMEELTLYEPDLFIIYTGHNEFLEERTYRNLREIPSFIKSTASLLTQTRTWTAMRSVLDSLGALPHTEKDGRVQLSGEVNTLLSRSVGPELYKRDIPLRESILMHYRISLERMVEIARSAGAEVIFVTPASNLKDSSPFKSQHTAGLDETAKKRSKELLLNAMDLIKDAAWINALEALDQALLIDPLFAELHYRRGKVLFALGRNDDAAEAFRRARDEDVCPLRALSPIREMLNSIAREKDISLVDFIDILEQRVLAGNGHRIPGQEYFLDHVHPTIEGNRILAAALVRTMIENGIVYPEDTWGEDTIAAVTSRVEGSLDRTLQASSLVNLARVLNWAGKYEDAGRLASQVMTYEKVAPEAYVAATAILATVYQRQGDIDQALQFYRRALNAAPESAQIHLQYGLMFLNKPIRNLEVAAAHILLATVFWPESDMAYLTFGLAMAERQRFDLAYSSLLEAVRINPQNADAKSALDRLRKLLDPDTRNPVLPKVSLDKYPSGAPNKIVQVRPDATGRYIPNGIGTEWYESGELKRFVDYTKGVPNGIEITWNPNGQVISRIEYRHGKQIRAAAGSHANGSK